MLKALINGTKICQLIAPGNEFDIAEPLTWADVPDDTTIRDTWDGTQVIKYVVPFAEIAKTAIKSEMFRVLVDGFTWRETNTDPWFTVQVDDAMQGFLTRTLLKLNEGRVDPHGGFIRSNGVSTSIDDTGMRELCLFAGVWGDAISAIRIAELDAVEAMTQQQLEAYDPYAVDWSVTWSGADSTNGWSDNTLTQTP